MFGSSTAANESAIDTSSPLEQVTSPKLSSPIDSTDSMERDRQGNVRSPAGRISLDEAAPAGEKKRRSSGVRAMLSNAKNSLHYPMASPDSKHHADNKGGTPMQKLGRTDPALSVPQGSLNNSAGESHPGPRSTFRVGVTEDKNKKCRRTMEDTHAYLYNFLSTPAPAIGPDANNISRSTLETRRDVYSNDIVETDNGYFAVFDGHAGTFAADWCGKKVHVILEEIIRKHPNTPIPELLDMTFTSVDVQLEKLPLKNSGCTAVTAVLRWEDRIPNSQSATGSTAIAPAAAAAVKAASEESFTKHGGAGVDGSDAAFRVGSEAETKLRETASRQRVLYTANVGDARIVLCRNGKALRLSYDHKGSDENEGKRIAGAGGLILNNRVNGVLAVTRALGDAYMKDLVTGHPYTTETVIQPDLDEFLILACDGVWDVCSDQEAVDLIRGIHDPQAASKALVDHSLARFSTDNLSCMIVRFDGVRVQQTVEHKAEPIGVEGDSGMRKGGMSEAEAIVQEQKRKLDESGEALDYVSPRELTEDNVEAGPELRPEALEAARKDKKPQPTPEMIRQAQGQ